VWTKSDFFRKGKILDSIVLQLTIEELYVIIIKNEVTLHVQEDSDNTFFINQSINK